MQQVQETLDIVQSCSSSASTLPIWCMIETPRGVLNADAIASTGGVECLVMGTADLTKDMHANHTPERTPMLYSLSRVLLSARAHGLAAVDGVHLVLGSDDDTFRRVCQQGQCQIHVFRLPLGHPYNYTL